MLFHVLLRFVRDYIAPLRRHLLSAKGLSQLTGSVAFCATHSVPRDLGFCGLVLRTHRYSRLLQPARGY